MPSWDNAMHIGNQKKPQWTCRCGCDTNNANRMICHKCGDAAPRGVKNRAIQQSAPAAARAGPPARGGRAHATYCAAAKSAGGAKGDPAEVTNLKRELAAIKRLVKVSGTDAHDTEDQPNSEPAEPTEKVICSASADYKRSKKSLDKVEMDISRLDKQIADATAKRTSLLEKKGQLEVETAMHLEKVNKASAAAGPAKQESSPLLSPALAGLDAATRQRPDVAPLIANLQAASDAVSAVLSKIQEDETQKAAQVAQAQAAAAAASQAAAASKPATSAVPEEPSGDTPMEEVPCSAEELRAVLEAALAASASGQDADAGATAKRFSEQVADLCAAKRAKTAPAPPQQP